MITSTQTPLANRCKGGYILKIRTCVSLSCCYPLSMATFQYMLLQVDLACRMAHLLYDCVGPTGGPTFLFLRFLERYSRICRGKSVLVTAVLEPRLQLLQYEEAKTWVPPLPQAKELDYTIVGLMDSVSVYSSSSAEGREGAVCEPSHSCRRGVDVFTS